MKRTNILLSDEQHRRLKIRSRRQGRTLGELVRQAVDASYGKHDALEVRRRIALDSYQAGFISLGKLSEVLGLDPVSTRLYLREAIIPLQSSSIDDVLRDAVNA
ncbi:MAG: UPF0175 family protein [Candidatus Methylomirabilia bacterium]